MAGPGGRARIQYGRSAIPGPGAANGFADGPALGTAFRVTLVALRSCLPIMEGSSEEFAPPLGVKRQVSAYARVLAQHRRRRSWGIALPPPGTY